MRNNRISNYCWLKKNQNQKQNQPIIIRAPYNQCDTLMLVNIFIIRLLYIGDPPPNVEPTLEVCLCFSHALLGRKIFN